MSESEDYLVLSDFEPSSRALQGVGVTLGESDADVGLGRIQLRIGRRPRAIPLIPLARRGGKKIDDAYHLLLRAYEPWIVFYTVGIQDTGDWRNVARFGLRVRLVDQPTAAVAAVFPESSCLLLGGGKTEWSGSLGISGAVSLSANDDEEEDAATVSLLSPLRSFGVDAHVSSRTDVVLKLKFQVVTPLVITTGANDDETQWTFVQGANELLTGDQIVGHILLLPKHSIGPLKLEATLFADIGLFWVFTRRYKSRSNAILQVELP